MIEVLDGISATVFGLAMPLIAADLTTRTGYLNLAIGSLGLAAGLGATASTTVAGWLADTRSVRRSRSSGSRWSGLPRLAMVWRMMPETRPASRSPVGLPSCRRRRAPCERRGGA